MFSLPQSVKLSGPEDSKLTNSTTSFPVPLTSSRRDQILRGSDLALFFGRSDTDFWLSETNSSQLRYLLGRDFVKLPQPAITG